MLIQFLLVLSMILALFVTWRRARQRVISIREALAWSIIWIAASILVLLPNVATQIAHLFGVGRGVDLVLYASVVSLFLMVFKLFIQHERLERRLTELVRRDALRELSNDRLIVIPTKAEPIKIKTVAAAEESLSDQA